MKRRLPVPGFFTALFLAVGLAWVFPELGATGGPLRSAVLIKIGIFVIFLNQGLMLPGEALKRGALDWRLHLYIQACIFLLYPALVFLALRTCGGWLGPDLKIGFLYMAMLPTTLSTSAVFTSKADGNVAGCVFNISLSNIIGVFIVPPWAVGILASVAGERLPVLPLLVKIASLLLLPFAIGQALRPFFKNRVRRRKKAIQNLNTGIVLFLLYASFCNSVVKGVWSRGGTGPVFAAIALVLALLLAMMAIVWAGTGWMRFNFPSRLAALFCGSQKSLAAGVAMASSIFANGADGLPEMSLVLLPVMCYHPLQLLFGGLFLGAVERKGRNPG